MFGQSYIIVLGRIQGTEVMSTLPQFSRCTRLGTVSEIINALRWGWSPDSGESTREDDPGYLPPPCPCRGMCPAWCAMWRMSVPGFAPRVKLCVAQVSSLRLVLAGAGCPECALFGAWERAIQRAVPCCVRPSRSSPRPSRRSFPFVRLFHWQLTLPVVLVF
jgi:hypothetical protein